MSRNFYVTGRIASGGQPRPGLHISADNTRADSNIIQLASRLPPGTVWPDSRSQEGEPFIYPFEFGSYCLLFGVLLVPTIFVCAAVFGYALFIAEPI